MKRTKPDNRETLKNYFKNGTCPTEENFRRLIDSMINKADDGISKNHDEGLILAPEGENSNKTMSFVNRIGQDLPNWSIDLMDGEQAGLGITQPTTDDTHKTKLFFNENGRVGIHTKTPVTDTEVQGVLGIQARVGTYKIDTIPADGKWHKVLDNLDGCNAFEIVAQVGKASTGKHALLHATAISTFGQYKNRIRRTQASYGWWWWNRLAIRWGGDLHNYHLKLKTRSNYGNDVSIKYHITKLWSPDLIDLFEQQEDQINESHV